MFLKLSRKEFQPKATYFIFELENLFSKTSWHSQAVVTIPAGKYLAKEFQMFHDS